MANFSIIRDLLEEKNITIRDFVSKIGISEDGLQKLIRKGSTNTATIENIAKELNVPVGIFFESKNVNQKNVNGDNINGNNVTISKAEAEKLHEIIKAKDDQIARLLSIIEKVSK